MATPFDASLFLRLRRFCVSMAAPFDVVYKFMKVGKLKQLQTISNNLKQPETKKHRNIETRKHFNKE